MSLTERLLLSMMAANPIFTPMKESPQLTEWTCRLLTWHGLYQHPMAKDKSKWYLFPAPSELDFMVGEGHISYLNNEGKWEY